MANEQQFPPSKVHNPRPIRRSTLPSLDVWGAAVHIGDMRKHAEVLETRDKPSATHRAGGRPIVQDIQIAWKGLANVQLPEGTEFDEIPEDGETPAYFHAKVDGIDVHLRGGVNPTMLDGKTCLVEIKLKTIRPKNHRGGTNYYWYLNLFPAEVVESTAELPELSICSKLPELIRESVRVYVPVLPGCQKRVQEGHITLTRPSTPATTEIDATVSAV